MTEINPLEAETSSKALLGDKMYDVLKFVALVLLPAVGTAYFGLAQVWGWSNAEKVVGTIMVVDTFLGLLLGIATKSYNKSDAKFAGTIQLLPNMEEGTTDMNFRVDPNKLAGSSEVVLKVDTIPQP
jgi:Putative phage holin Dp-1